MTDTTNLDEAQEPRINPALKRALLGLFGFVGLAFLAGMVSGYLGAMAERGGIQSVTGYAVLAAMFLAIIALCWGVWRLWPSSTDEPIAPSAKRSRNMLYVSAALGVVIAIYLTAAPGGETEDLLFSNGPVEVQTALVVIFAWLVLTPIVSFLWWRNVDEHEAGAYREGAFYAGHAYLFVAPAWWFASRAGLIPPQEPMIVLLGFMTIWLVVWFVRRYV